MKTLISLIILVPLFLRSQYGMYSTENYHYIGNHGNTNDSIFAIDVSFAYPLLDLKLDSVNNNLILTFEELTNDGYSTIKNLNAIYNLNDLKIIWSTLANSEKVYFRVNDNKVYHYNKEGSGLWDTKDLKFKWQLKSPLFFHPELDKMSIAIAPAHKADENGFAAINLNDGSVRWKNYNLKVAGNAIVNPLILDSFLFFINESLHVINYYNGEYKNYSKVFNIFQLGGDGGMSAGIYGGFFGALIYNSINDAVSRAGNKDHSHFARHYSNFLLNEDTIICEF